MLWPDLLCVFFLQGTVLFYQPGLLHGGPIEHDCNTQRSIGYYLEALLMLAPFMKTSLKATLRGVTNDPSDPTVRSHRACSCDRCLFISLLLISKYELSISWSWSVASFTLEKIHKVNALTSRGSLTCREVGTKDNKSGSFWGFISLVYKIVNTHLAVTSVFVCAHDVLNHPLFFFFLSSLIWAALHSLVSMSTNHRQESGKKMKQTHWRERERERGVVMETEQRLCLLL